MKYQRIKQYDVANGEGIRTSIFLSGCSIKCPDCFNSELWDFNKGLEFVELTKSILFSLLEDSHCDGLSVLGGEPTDQGKELSDFLQEVKNKFPTKDIWLWTGRYLEQLINSGNSELLKYVDVIVDGPFIKELKDLNLKFRGSSNQHIWKKINNIWTVID